MAANPFSGGFSDDGFGNGGGFGQTGGYGPAPSPSLRSEPGIDTGFHVYGTGSADSGFEDSRPSAFSSFFDGGGKTPTPAFDAMTDMYRSSFAPLAARIRNTGDMSAVNMRDEAESRLTGLRHLYGVGRAAGVNDRTAADGVRATLRTVDRLRSQLGSSDLAYADRYQSYIVGQSKQRGYSVDDLADEEDRLDSAFRASLSKSRADRMASGDPGSGRYSDFQDGTPGFEATLSLAARVGLQEYERSHGLYSTADREEVLAETARLLDRVNSNAALRARYAGRTGEIVGMAAKKVLERDVTSNLFDRIDGAISGISDGYVTYTGNQYLDSSSGYVVKDGKGRAVNSGLASVVRKCLMDQAVDDEINGPDRHSETLRTRLADTLAQYYRASSFGFDAETARDVFGKMADLIVDMDRNGHVNLSELQYAYLDPSVRDAMKASSSEVAPMAVGTKLFDSLQSAGNDVVDELVGGRSAVYGNPLQKALKVAGASAAVGLSGVVPLLGGTFRDRILGTPADAGESIDDAKQYVDPESVRLRVSEVIKNRLVSDGVSEQDVKKYGAYVDQMASWLTASVVDINTMRSSGMSPDASLWVSDDDVKNIKDRAVRSVAVQLAVSSRLAELGYSDVPGLSYGRTHGKPGVLGNNPLGNYADRRSPYRNAFGGLIAYLRDKTNGVNPEDPNMTDADFVRYHAALSYLRGLEQTLRSGDDPGKVAGGSSEIEKRKGVAAKMLGLSGFSGSLSSMDPSATSGVSDAWSARQSAARAREIAARNLSGTGNEARQALLNRVLSRGYSDKINPVMDEKIRTVSSALVEKYGSGLTGASAELALRQVMTAVSQAMGDLGMVVTGDGEDGGKVVAFNPLAMSLGDTKLADRMEKMIGPVLKSVKASADEMEKIRMAALANKTETAGMAKERVKEMAENGEALTLRY